MAKAKKPTITVRRASDGASKEILKSEIVKYTKLGYKVDWVVTKEVKAEAKPAKKKEEPKKED